MNPVTIYKEYEHVTCACGGVIRKDNSVKGFICDKCKKPFAISPFVFSGDCTILTNPKSDLKFLMKKRKEKKDENA